MASKGRTRGAWASRGQVLAVLRPLSDAKVASLESRSFQIGRLRVADVVMQGVRIVMMVSAEIQFQAR